MKMTKRMKADIENAVKALGLEEKIIFTTGELDAICAESKCDLFAVMYYLRFER